MLKCTITENIVGNIIGQDGYFEVYKQNQYSLTNDISYRATSNAYILHNIIVCAAKL